MKGTKAVALGALVAATMLGSAIPEARAATKTWNSATNPAWLTGTNWNPSGVPTLNDIATFASVGPASITIAMNSGTNNGTANQIVGEIALTSTKSFTISNGSTTTAGTLTLNGVAGTLLSNSATAAYTLTLANGAAQPMNVAFANSGNIAVNNSLAVISISSAAGGAVDLSKSGNGMLRLLGDNSFGGAGHTFAVNGGAIDAVTDASLGDPDTLWVLNGGAIQSSQPTVTYTHAFRLDAAGGTFGGATTASTMTLAGNISGTGGLTKSGWGTLIISGPTVNYTGPTVFDGGLVCLATNLTGTGAVSVAPTTATSLYGTATVAGATTLGNGTVLQPGPGFPTPAPGALTFTRGLTFGAGSQYVWDLNAYSTANPGVDFSVINAGTALSIADGTQVKLSFTGSAAGPGDSTDAFWDAAHDWTIATSAASTGTFTVATAVTKGAFSVTNSGSDVVLHYAPPYTGPRTLAWAGVAGGAVSDSCGTWDAATNNWVKTTDGTSAVWNSANPDVATFGACHGAGGAATVTLGGSVTAGQASFAADSACYTLTGGTLTLSGVGGVGINAHASAMINSHVVLADNQTWAIDSGATLSVTGDISGPFTLTKAGGGTLTCTAANTMAGCIVTAGTLVLDHPGAAGAGALAIHNDAAVRLTPGGAKTLVLPALALDDTASLDLADNALIVHHGDVARLQSLINHAYNDAAYDTPGATAAGITTSSHTAVTTLGTLTGSTFTALHNSTSFGSFDDVAADDVLAKYTYFGDIDLDGIVTGRDYRLMDAGYLAGFDGVARVAAWADGDVNHDQIVDYKDFALADAAASQVAALDQNLLALHSAEFGAPYVLAYDAAVPEPTTLALFGFGITALLRRRRT